MSAFTQLINQGSRALHGQAGKEITLYPTGTGKNAQQDGATIVCQAIVQELRKGRLMDASGNWRDAYMGRISLTLENNPTLGEQLTAINARLVPEQWKLEMDSVKYRITNPSVDETAWEFDIKELI